MSGFEHFGSLQPMVEAVLGGLISILLVAVARRSWPRVMAGLQRLWGWLKPFRPVLKQVMIGILGSMLVLTGIQLDAFLGDALKVETGTITLDPRNPGYSSLTDIGRDECPENGSRGDMNKRVTFVEPFMSPPDVMIAFSIIESDLGKTNRGTRLFLEAKDIDKEGFNYDLYTWCNGQVWWVRASWMAVGK